MGGKALPPLFLLPPSIVQEVLKFSTIAVERIVLQGVLLPEENVEIADASHSSIFWDRDT
jgi:hypothetical protein